MYHLEGDSEVYKLMQENRDTRAAPRQSSTFRLLQVALELDEKGERGRGWAGHLSTDRRKEGKKEDKWHNWLCILIQTYSNPAFSAAVIFSRVRYGNTHLQNKIRLWKMFLVRQIA